ncbi:MAG: T9SS type A sorting domain-containing protein, partial [Saprospiraceae bacterium]
NIVDVTPANTYAAGKGFDYIYKGRPDRSFLFRKANQGLEQTIDMHADEGGTMPPATQPQLTDVEKEMIRQWVLYGAPQNGEVVEEQLIEDYYGGMGLASFDAPPPAPDPSEGFQIKMGPFYLEPQGQPKDELEYFLKYELDMPEDVDVDRIDMKISPSSHHLIVYAFDPPVFAQLIDPGLRLEANHSAIDLVAAIQESTDLRLPETTAFTWQNDMILDLNSHYINYSASQVLQAEAYINIYTKEAGSAEHEMKTELIVKPDIPIPNNANTIEYSDIEASNSYGEIFIWGIMGHTHKYGTSYKAYKRVNGQQDEIIYDAACSDGAPGCVSPFFDYQHIPMRYFEPLLPMDMTNGNGLIHTASWLNDGPFPVNFGPTSDDEMMVLVLMYTDEQIGDPVSNNEITNEPSLKIYPNPMDELALLELPERGSTYNFRLYDVLGKEVRSVDRIETSDWLLERGSLGSGMYVYVVLGEDGERYTGKLLIE